MWKNVEGGGVNKRILFHQGIFNRIISTDNLFLAWQNYRKGKRGKTDVRIFEFQLEDNLFQLHQDLATGQYQPGSYQQFKISDPKARLISKASVRDRLLHQAIYQVLYPDFDPIFIFDSYSCRNDKGTHKAFQRLTHFSRQVSNNYSLICWGLKLDIRKFFDSIDQSILLQLLAERIDDGKLLALLKQIISSFQHSPGKGMPLGNLTSQLFANVYMDPLDKFVKHQLRVKHYLRYADDFLILARYPSELLGYFVEINRFLKEELKLQIHPNKVTLRKLRQGIDFVGYVARPHYSLPRRKTIRRLVKKLTVQNQPSYFGYLQHVSSYRLRQELEKNLRIAEPEAD